VQLLVQLLVLLLVQLVQKEIDNAQLVLVQLVQLNSS
jgi:hypothetical protein